MSESRIKLKDRVVAEALALGSSVQIRFPAARHINEELDALSHVSVRWLHARIAADSIHNWLTVPGNPSAGRTPKGYSEKAVIAAPRAEIDTRQQAYDGRHAVAYALGSAVMVGVMLEQEIFGNTEGSDAYRVAMGIGRGPLQATMGVWHSDQGLWVPDGPIQTEGRYAAADLPANIPSL